MPTLLLDHARQDELGQGDGSKKVDLHDAPVHIEVSILRKRALPDARVVYQNVDARKPLQDCRGCVLPLVRVSDVKGHNRNAARSLLAPSFDALELCYPPPG